MVFFENFMETVFREIKNALRIARRAPFVYTSNLF